MCDSCGVCQLREIGGALPFRQGAGEAVCVVCSHGVQGRGCMVDISPEEIGEDGWGG